ncbi:MAG: class I SAM-dependent methyltransferase [bacterium]
MPTELQAYWDRKIADWERSCYEREKGDGGANFMSRLRSSVDARMKTALTLLAPTIADQTVLDLGCGAGVFALLLLNEGARHVVGVDISPVAVELAQRRARESNLHTRTTFICGKVTELDLPPADFTTALGLLDWMHLGDVEKLLGKLRGRRMLLTYSEKDYSLAELIHRIYLVERLKWTQREVRAYHFTRAEVIERWNRQNLGPHSIIRNRQMRFGAIIHNLSGERREPSA